MTLQAAKFTPEILISSPRRGPGIPNPSGTSVLYTCSSYSFETHSKTETIRLLDVKTGETSVISENPSYKEPTWVGDREILVLDVSASDEDVTALLYWDLSSGSEPETIHRFAGNLSNLKVKRVSEHELAFACTAETTLDGKIRQPHKEAKPRSSAQVYSQLYVRHWDTWQAQSRNSIWYGLLKEEGGRYGLEKPGLVNALAGTKLECPIPPFGGAEDFDISSSGIIFVSRDPAIDPSYYTKSDLYYVPLASFAQAKPPTPQVVKTKGLSGYSVSPTFSRDGKKVAFCRMRNIQYEADKTRLLLIPDIDRLEEVHEFYSTGDGEGAWDFSPSGIEWSIDDSELYVTAERHGKNVLWRLPSSPERAKELPEPIYTEDSTSHYTLLSGTDSRLLISTSSLVESSRYSVLDPATKEITILSSATKNGKTIGLSRSQVSDFWFTGCDDRRVHALVMKPSTFDAAKKYPLAFLVHGGPQGSWGDSWSTRWNPAVYAEQGYVVVLPNPTGSTGYGQEFTDRIQNEWGGRPYQDLERCWEHISATMPYVDVENGVTLGASYGGYMMNWIQGHPLGRKFKAMVCHDGIFSTMNQWSMDEIFFPTREFGGTIWENRAMYEKWDPMRFTDKWATPMLVIHGDRDYRVPMTEGLATFNVLQGRGIPSRLLVFPDENHWVLKHENSLVWHREVLGFINKYSGIDEQDSDQVKGVESLSI
ncbi:related to secreted dipeptidyl-peptidase V precursor [Cephalotrichum gorgonifer]|uniref:Dipeptidyl-peptidase V n=1 Tax=Cephalotrichum gorgonifer TaxID=2041049 RepID=A0AAE8N0I4_9PEZI|nr:related to secreted dipeptidyl-peptidase V precursor [Cephalotrichum gorgonifer]